jgi:hypothetical protein
MAEPAPASTGRESPQVEVMVGNPLSGESRYAETFLETDRWTALEKFLSGLLDRRRSRSKAGI